MSASSTLTFESTLAEIHQAHPDLKRPKISARKKTKDKDTVCTLCYLRLIQGIDINEITQIMFKYRSIRQHYKKFIQNMEISHQKVKISFILQLMIIPTK